MHTSRERHPFRAMTFAIPCLQPISYSKMTSCETIRSGTGRCQFATISYFTVNVAI